MTTEQELDAAVNSLQSSIEYKLEEAHIKLQKAQVRLDTTVNFKNYINPKLERIKKLNKKIQTEENTD